MSDVITIGIAGGTGSGKTTITRRILDEFGGDVSVLYHDNYYKRHDDIPFAERKKLNYDHPNAFDTPLLVQHLDALRAGQPVACPTYDYTVHNRAAETITVVPAKVVVVEGILIFAEPALRERLDIKIFVDTDADVRILRRIVRDVRDPRPRSGVDRDAVSDHGQAHARDVRRAVQALCRHHHPRGRAQPGGARFRHGAHPGLRKGAGLNGQTLL